MLKWEFLVGRMRIAGAGFIVLVLAVCAGILSPVELLAAVPAATIADLQTGAVAHSGWPPLTQRFAQVEAPGQQPAAAPSPDAVVPTVEPATPQQPSPQSPPAETQAAEPQPSGGGILGRMQEWLARSRREFQNVIIKDLSVPPAGKTAEDEIAKKLAETKAEEAKKAEEARRASEAKEQAQRDENNRRLAAKEAEAQRKKAEDEARKAAETFKKKAAEDAKKAAAVPAQPPAPQTDAAANEKARIVDELRKTEEAQQDEARKKLNAETTDADRAGKAREEAERQAEEARKLEIERRKADALIAEERRKRDAEAADARRRAEDAIRQAERQQQPPPAVERSAVEQPAPVQQPKAAEQRRVVITPEPLRQSQAEHRKRVNTERQAPQIAGEPSTPRERRRHVKLYRVAEARVPYRGTAVKRFVYRLSPGARACRGAGRVVAAPTRYTVANGDSLWRISGQHYSSGSRWPLIYRANRAKISDPDLIYPCQRFLVPGR